MTLHQFWLTLEINVVLLAAVGAFATVCWLLFVGSIKALRWLRSRVNRTKYQECATCSERISRGYIRAMNRPAVYDKDAELPALLRKQAE